MDGISESLRISHITLKINDETFRIDGWDVKLVGKLWQIRYRPELAKTTKSFEEAVAWCEAKKMPTKGETDEAEVE